jgi:hypothetical protein
MASTRSPDQGISQKSAPYPLSTDLFSGKLPPQRSPPTAESESLLKQTEEQQQRLYFFLWSFLMIFLLRFLHLSLFSSNAIIILYLFWPNSFNFIFRENILLHEFVKILQHFLLLPLTNFTFKFLVNIILSPYVLYLIFVEEIQPFIPSHLPLLNRLKELSLFLSNRGIPTQDQKSHKNSAKMHSSSSSMSCSSFQQKLLESDSDEILQTESLDSFVSTEPFSPVITSRGPTLTSPLPPTTPPWPVQKPTELKLLDPEEVSSVDRFIISNSRDYLQEHHVPPPLLSLPLSRHHSSTKQTESTHVTNGAFPAPVTPTAESHQDLLLDPSTPSPDTLQQTPASALRGNDYLAKLQRVARQSTAEKKKRTTLSISQPSR